MSWAQPLEEEELRAAVPSTDQVEEAAEACLECELEPATPDDVDNGQEAADAGSAADKEEEGTPSGEPEKAAETTTERISPWVEGEVQGTSCA